jgi:hypothetical protein
MRPAAPESTVVIHRLVLGPLHSQRTRFGADSDPDARITPHGVFAPSFFGTTVLRLPVRGHARGIALAIVRAAARRRRHSTHKINDQEPCP